MSLLRRHRDDSPDALATAAFTTVREAQDDAAQSVAYAETLAALAEAMAATMARNGNGGHPLVREARRVVTQWRAFTASRGA